MGKGKEIVSLGQKEEGHYYSIAKRIKYKYLSKAPIQSA